MVKILIKRCLIPKYEYTKVLAFNLLLAKSILDLYFSGCIVVDLFVIVAYNGVQVLYSVYD